MQGFAQESFYGQFGFGLTQKSFDDRRRTCAMNLNVLELIPRYLESTITGEQSGQQESENMNLVTKLQIIGFAATSWEVFLLICANQGILGLHPISCDVRKRRLFCYIFF